MLEYKIKIFYETGNSLRKEEIEDYLELTWKNLDIAKENLLRIKEHYEMYRKKDKWNSKLSEQQIIDQNKHKDWFVNKPELFCISTNSVIDEKDKKKVGDGNWEYRPDFYSAMYCLKLKADNGNIMQMTAFWCGYFETLHSVKIEHNNNDMEISF